MKEVRFLADVNVEKPIVEFLISQGYDVKWIPDYDCAMPDHDLMTLANDEKRILVTNDKDFGELVFLQKHISAGVILFRVKGQPVNEKVRLLEELLRKHVERLSVNLVVLTEKKIRITPLEGIS